MNNKKTLLLILTIILITGCINTANAANNTTTIEHTTTHDNKEIKTQNTDTTTENVTTYKELTTAINNAKKATTANYLINMKKSEYNITNQIIWGNIKGNVKNLTINGENSTINGNNNKNFIRINTNCSININNLTIKNTKNRYGSAIFTAGNTNINHLTLENNHATTTNNWGGGAILNTGHITITNTTFINNTSNSDGGAIYNLLNNIENKGIVIINECKFINNNARTGSSIYNFNGRNVEINNTIFTNENTNDSIIYIQDYSNSTLINNTIIQNCTSRNNLITNLENLTITNSIIQQNNVTNNILFNNGTICSINNMTINQNQQKTIIHNYDNILLKNSHITYNYADNGIINNNTLLITNTTFSKNTLNNSLIYDTDGQTKTLFDKFYNNKCPDLFIGTNKTFIQVEKNIYIGNNLRYTDLTINKRDYYNYDDNITINGKITVNPIYNTTVNSGIITTYYNDEKIDTTNVINGSYNISKLINKTGNLKLKLIYDGENNYTSTSGDVDIQIEAPSYIINMTTKNDSHSFEDKIEYTVTITNIGKGNGSNITIYNIIPDNLEYINSTDYINTTTSTWHINKLNSNQTRNITIYCNSKTKNDINISITNTDPVNNKNNTINKTIKYIEARYTLNYEKYNTTYKYYDGIYNKFIVKNMGEGRGSNITITLTLKDENSTCYNKTWLFDKINSNETRIIELENKLRTTGLISGNLSIKDSAENYNTLTFNYTILKPYISFNNITAHYGDVINLTAEIHNLNINSTGKFIFKLNHKTIRNHTLSINNTIITLFNYEISNLRNNQNSLEVKYSQKGLNNTLINNTTLNLLKYKVYSKIRNITTFPGNYINITAEFYDENNNTITNGEAVFKINGKTIKDEHGNIIYLKIHDGIVKLSNYQIPLTFNNREYTINLSYSGSNKYYANRNNTILQIEHQDIIITITNTTYIPGENYVIKVVFLTNTTKSAIHGGNTVFKINGKTITPKIPVKRNIITYTYDTKNCRKINNITVCFSGNKIYNEKRTLISYETIDAFNSNSTLTKTLK